MLPVLQCLANEMGVALICWPATPSMLLLLKAISNSALCWLTKGQTLEKIMDCLRSVHLKNQQASNSANTTISQKKFKLWSHSAVTWPHEKILLSFLLLFPSNCYCAKKKNCTHYDVIRTNRVSQILSFVAPAQYTHKKTSLRLT